jgi:predicted nucleotidyltransferase
MAMSIPLTANEARVLTALVRLETPLSGRALARITDLTQSAAQRALTRLRIEGLVTVEPAPPSLLYRANRAHLAMPALLTLLHLDDELRARTAECVAGWQLPPESLVIYGSVARGDAGPSSDLDVLVVRSDGTQPDEPAWQHQVAELAERLSQWTGRQASIIDINRREAAEGLAAQEPFLVQADREGWLVAGRALRMLSGSQT